MEAMTSQRSEGPARLVERVRPALAAPGLAGWMLALLLACATYAAFAGGAAAIPAESRVQVGVAFAALLAGLGIASGALGAARSPLAWAGVALLGLFALFSALSVSWSAAPAESWLAANRAVEYTAVVAIVLVAAPSVARAQKLGLVMLTVLGLVIALYALGGKLFPTVSVGPINLDQASQFARLRAPFGYWNALGLLLVMSMPGCLWVAADTRRSQRLRVWALVGLELLLVAAALTLSRGAVSRPRRGARGHVPRRRQAARDLRGGAARRAVRGPGRLLRLRQQRAQRGRDSRGAPGRRRDPAGPGAGGLDARPGLGGQTADAPTRRRVRPGRVGRRLWRMRRLFVLVGVLALALLAVSSSGWLGRQWNDFKKPVGISNQPGRFISANSSNRWIWWGEAAGRSPTGRSSAGGGVVPDPPLPLPPLSDPGALGAQRAASVPRRGGVGRRGAGPRRGGAARRGGRRRGPAAARAPSARCAAALLAAASAWAVHCLYDWDWEIPGVTLPALAAFALAAARLGSSRRWIDRRRRRGGEGPGYVRPALAVPIAVAASRVGGRRGRLGCAAGDLPVDPPRRPGRGGSAPPASETRRLERAPRPRRCSRTSSIPSTWTPASLRPTRGSAGPARAGSEPAHRCCRLSPDNYRTWELLALFAERLRQRAARPARDRAEVRRRAAQLRAQPGAARGLGVRHVGPPQLSPTAFGTPPGACLEPAWSMPRIALPTAPICRASGTVNR